MFVWQVLFGKVNLVLGIQWAFLAVFGVTALFIFIYLLRTKKSDFWPEPKDTLSFLVLVIVFGVWKFGFRNRTPVPDGNRFPPLPTVSPYVDREGPRTEFKPGDIPDVMDLDAVPPPNRGKAHPDKESDDTPPK